MALPSKNSFVASLFVMALMALLVGGMELWELIEYRLYSQPATMVLSDPDQRIPQFTDDLTYTHRDVKYTSDAGVVEMTGRAVSKDVAARLDAGQSVPIVYYTNNPRRIFYDGRKPEVGWLWLVAGVAMLGLAFYALKLRKREA